MDARPKRSWMRWLFVGLLIAVVFLAIRDYTTCRMRHRRAMAVVSELGGSAGSLLGWPLGKEYCISFERPLTEGELRRLTVLNDLVDRNYVAVYFDCDLSPQQLNTAQRLLAECHVRQSEAGAEAAQQ